MKTILALLFAACALAPVMRAQIEQPRLGTMLTRDGSPWAVFGVAGSVTIGAVPAATDPTSSPASGPTSGPTSVNAPASAGVVPTLPIVSMGCSRRMCLMKTESSLVSLAGSMPGVDAPAGPALFWFEHATALGNSVLVYFPRSRQLARWQNGQLSPVNFDVTGEILSIGEASDGTLRFAVRNPAGTWVVRHGDVIVDSLHGPVESIGAGGPVLLLHGGVLFTTDAGLILRRPDGSELVFRLGQVGAEQGFTRGSRQGLTHGSTMTSEPRPSGSEAPRLEQVALSWLGENYVQVRVRGSGGDYSNYALRVDIGHERMFLMPEPQP